MVRVLVIHLKKKLPKLDEKAKEELMKKAQEVLKNYPGVQFKGTFVDENGIGVCDWEAPRCGDGGESGQGAPRPL
jgi:hypothetical protein